MEITKYTIYWFLGIVAFMATIVASAQTIVDKMAEVEADKNPDGSYNQQMRVGNVEVHVYEAPNKQYGYQVIEYFPDGTVTSIGTGIEADERTYVYEKFQSR